MNKKYVKSLGFLTRKKMDRCCGSFMFWNYRFLFQITPSGFIPNEDRGIIFADVTLPPGSTLENTENTVKELDSIIESMDIVEARMNIVGFSLLNNITVGPTFSVIKLKDWSERTEDGQSVDAVVKQLFAKTASMKDAKILFFTPPSIRD
jgi:HAE1 family hydrophobic/amphiphilic exporter-1